MTRSLRPRSDTVRLPATTVRALLAAFAFTFLVVTVLASSAAPARAASTAEFLDHRFFDPHDSPITGQMVVDNWRWYGVDVLAQLVILGAETSLGDPRLGGELVQANNFGCLRYHGAGTRWGELSSGKVWVDGKDWYAFPSPEVGMKALGRYLKVGRDGFYLGVLDGPGYQWSRFASAYYGSGVPGLGAYETRLRSLERSFRTKAADAGFSW